MTDERTFPHATESIVKARRFTRSALTGLPRELVDSIEVMVSELATNSVRHAATDFAISIDRRRRSVRVEVSDSADRLPNLRTPQPADYSGRGLQIVGALADEWGVTEMVDRPGKTVWFVVALEPDAPHLADRALAPPAVSERGSGPSTPGSSRPAPRKPSPRSRRRPPGGGATSGTDARSRPIGTRNPRPTRSRTRRRFGARRIG